MPWLWHGIFATVFGSINTALQSVGRLQRYYSAYQSIGYKILQDHGGFMWRHGSPNENREWSLGEDVISWQKSRIEKVQKGEKLEPTRCKCGFWRIGGAVCPECGNSANVSVRVVRQMNGRLKSEPGWMYAGGKARNKSAARDPEKIWRSALISAGFRGETIKVAIATANRIAAKRGVAIDWKKLADVPAHHNAPENHYTVTDYVPWVARIVNAKRRRR